MAGVPRVKFKQASHLDEHQGKKIKRLKQGRFPKVNCFFTQCLFLCWRVLNDPVRLLRLAAHP